jgi:chemotaxis protein MotB
VCSSDLDAIFNGGLPSTFDSSSPGILSGGCFDLKQMGRELEEREKALEEKEKALSENRDDRIDLASSRPTDRPQNPDLTELPEGQEGGEGANQTGVAPGEGIIEQPTPGPGMGDAAFGEQSRRAKTMFAQQLTESVDSELAGQGLNLEGQFAVEIVPGGLKIQIMDKEGRPMFVSGQPRLTPLAQTILASVAARLASIPNKLAIEGHTDSVATASQELTNWELSTARASSTRRFLSRQGVTDDRLTMVAGFAATQPLPGHNPTDPVNRRVAILIWDEPSKPAPASSSSAAPPDRLPPPAGVQSSPPPPSRPMVPRRNQRPSQENLEQRLLDETLKKAAQPDASTAGPPVGPQ